MKFQERVHVSARWTSTGLQANQETSKRQPRVSCDMWLSLGHLLVGYVKYSLNM